LEIWEGVIGKREAFSPFYVEIHYQTELRLDLSEEQSGINFWTQNLFEGEELSSTKLHGRLPF